LVPAQGFLPVQHILTLHGRPGMRTAPVMATPLGGTSDRWRKSTKQVATVGPASNTFEMLEKLFLAGVDVFRLNFSHGAHEEKAALVGLLRALEAKHGRPVGILADLQGPKHRVGMFPDQTKVSLTKGQMYRFDLNKDALGDGSRVSLPHPDVLEALQVTPRSPDVLEALQVGHRVLIDDGKLVVVVRAKGAGFVDTEVMNDATVSSRKGFNLPDTLVASSPITLKDRADLEFIVQKLDVDWVALSFVQEPGDMVELRSLADAYHKAAGKAGGYRGKFMAKLEKPSAVTEHLDAIVALSDGIMVARGDLGVEMVVESVPITQRRIIASCHKQGRPVIVATQMLESMIESPTPTRAEVSDIATAIFDGADAVMLSAESAAGKYPVEAVSTQQRIISTVEGDASYRAQVKLRVGEMIRSAIPTDAITDAARIVAEQIGAKAIVVFTKSGTTVLRASRDRPTVPILAATSSAPTARFLTLAWGVGAVPLQDSDFAQTADMDALLSKVLASCKAQGIITEPLDLIVVTNGFPFGVPGAVNNLRVVSAAGPAAWDPLLCNGAP
jgi:pyruvate kinase